MTRCRGRRHSVREGRVVVGQSLCGQAPESVVLRRLRGVTFRAHPRRLRRVSRGRRRVQRMLAGMSVMYPCPAEQCCGQERISEKRQRFGQWCQRMSREDLASHDSKQE